jgi:hypothetical protein
LPLLTNFALLLLQSYCPSSPCPLQPHLPCRHSPPSRMPPLPSPSQPHSHVAVLVAGPLAATCTPFLCALQLHGPCCCLPRSHTCHVPMCLAACTTSLLPRAPHCCLSHSRTCCIPTCHIAASLAAAHATSLCTMLLPPSQLHMLCPCMPHCCLPRSHTRRVYACYCQDGNLFRLTL